MKRHLQTATALSEQPQGHQHVTTTPAKLLTEAEAADRCRYFDRGCADPVRAFRQWARRAGVPVKVVARRRLYDLRVLDAFLEREPWTVRHRAVRHA